MYDSLLYVNAPVSANNTPDNTAVSTKQKTTARERADGFTQILKEYDAEKKKLDEESAQRKKQEENIRLEKRRREKRVNEILSLIARYQSKLSGVGINNGAAAMIDSLKTELFWLTFGL